MQRTDALLYQRASNDQSLEILEIAHCKLNLFSGSFHKQSETNMTFKEEEIFSSSAPIQSMRITFIKSQRKCSNMYLV